MKSVINIPVLLENKIKIVVDNHEKLVAVYEKLYEHDTVALDDMYTASNDILPYYTVISDFDLLKMVFSAVKAAIFVEADYAVVHLKGPEVVDFNYLIHELDYPTEITRLEKLLYEVETAVVEEPATKTKSLLDYILLR